MTLREIHTHELPVVRDLAFAIWPVTYGEILSKPQLDFMLESFYSIEALQSSLDKGHRYILIEDTKPLGFVGYEHQYQGAPVTRIHKIYVLPETQGKGVGKLLLEHVEALAREQHAGKLSLNVNRFNKALGFYHKMGFAITAEEDIAIGHGYLMEDYRMEKKLGDF